MPLCEEGKRNPYHLRHRLSPWPGGVHHDRGVDDSFVRDYRLHLAPGDLDPRDLGEVVDICPQPLGGGEIRPGHMERVGVPVTAVEGSPEHTLDIECGDNLARFFRGAEPRANTQ